VRARIRSSKVAVFLRDEKRYVAEGDGWECSASHDLVRWLQEHAAIVESATLDSVENAAIEASIRQKLGEWNSRLLVPLEVHGALEGWVVFGPRADGRPYSAPDRDDALMLVQAPFAAARASTGSSGRRSRRSARLRSYRNSARGSA
jgi:hypothetical protein